MDALIIGKERPDVIFVQQSVYCLVTDAAMNTASYEQFATGYHLTRKAMERFRNARTTDPAQCREVTAPPNQGSLEQLNGRPDEIVAHGTR